MYAHQVAGVLLAISALHEHILSKANAKPPSNPANGADTSSASASNGNAAEAASGSTATSSSAKAKAQIQAQKQQSQIQLNQLTQLHGQVQMVAWIVLG